MYVRVPMLLSEFTHVVTRMHEYVMAETENVFIQDAFTNSNAQVVCKQLGCKGGTQRQRFGGGVGPIWMDNVYCTGKEEVLSSCRFNGWGRHNCGHHEVIESLGYMKSYADGQ